MTKYRYELDKPINEFMADVVVGNCVSAKRLDVPTADMGPFINEHGAHSTREDFSADVRPINLWLGTDEWPEPGSVPILMRNQDDAVIQGTISTEGLIALGFHIRKHHSDKTAAITLSDEDAHALWNWSQAEESPNYWEIPGLGSVIAQVKEYILYG